MALHRNKGSSAAAGIPGLEPPSYELDQRNQNNNASADAAAAPPPPEGKHKKPKKPRPWKQQNLPHFFPVLTPTLASIPLLAVALIFIPVGAYLYHANAAVGEVFIDYTQCSVQAPTSFAAPAAGVSPHILQWQYTASTGACDMRVNVGWHLVAPVFMYIRLTEFYQNHRLYLKSKSEDQVGGTRFAKAGDITGDCGWLRYANCDSARKAGSWTGTGNMADMNPDCRTPLASRDPIIVNADPNAQYYPCGLIANSVFSDDISSLTSATTNQVYNFGTVGISWPEDEATYKNSPWFTDPTFASAIPTTLIPPPAWRHLYPTGYNSTNYPNVATDERLQVWMRVAGFPSFRKLWGRNNTQGLDEGVYSLTVIDRFPVIPFGGTKSIVLSNLGPVGSRESFLGIAFLVIGCVAAFLAFMVWIVRFR
ncbi:hypothetical protein HKX48_001020 [Thoreauomyces humboldtii]|nr:hypothetical protein HKX48_001020 [Thoreauomyces humboldtii]